MIIYDGKYSICCPLFIYFDMMTQVSPSKKGKLDGMEVDKETKAE